ncbi:hypothetical protein [Brevibacterium sp. 1718]|uniref:hypothetical protein n=1 Tax=Brevibacterium sp. 1718 TaxID=3413510 RepID=UPI003DA8AD21
MAENKTQPTDADVAAYLDSVTPEKRREDGIALDAIFRDVTGEEPVMWGPRSSATAGTTIGRP